MTAGPVDRSKNFNCLNILAATNAMDTLMPHNNTGQPLFYPQLGALFDCWFIRLSGVGLGNAMYSYFHTLVKAKAVDGVLIEPPWLSAKLGHILRGERANRHYSFYTIPDEISGLRKFLVLCRYFLIGRIKQYDLTAAEPPHLDKLNSVVPPPFTFVGLHEHRALIRQRFLALVHGKTNEEWPWGKAPYIAVHVRLGDFKIADASEAVAADWNTRIPMNWYVDVVQALRRAWPNLPIRIFSDGHAAELQPLLDLGATVHQGTSDAADLLDLAAASLLVVSNSTYSYWAAFLGNMPTIWLKRDKEREISTDPSVPFVQLSLPPSVQELSQIPRLL